MQFEDKDFKRLNPAEITAKLQQVDEFESNYKPNAMSQAMKKWCTDYEYRKREWQFRQNVANSMNFNKDYR